MRSKILGIDFDGTICDTTSLKRQYLLERHNILVPPWHANRTDLKDMFGISDSEYDMMIAMVCSMDATMEANEVPGAIEAIKELGKTHRIIIVTGRNGFLLSSAKEWIDSHGLGGIIEAIVSSELTALDKMDICKERSIDVMIDDDPGHFGRKRSDTSAILLRNGCNDSGGRFCASFARSWKEALRLLNT